MMTTSTSISSVIGIITLIGATFSAYLFLDSRHAAADDLMMVANRVENKIVGDQIYQLEQRIWRIKEQLGTQPGNDFLRSELQRLQSDLKRLERQQRQ